SPIGKQIVDRANKSISETAPIFKSLGLLDTTDPDVMLANMQSRKENTEEGRERRKALRDAIAFKRYEFDAHGVEMNQRYQSAAVITDAAPLPGFTEDPELVYQPSAFPGARLPHAWIEKNGRDISTLDVTGHGKFTLLTGIGGDPW